MSIKLKTLNMHSLGNYRYKIQQMAPIIIILLLIMKTSLSVFYFFIFSLKLTTKENKFTNKGDMYLYLKIKFRESHKDFNFK